MPLRVVVESGSYPLHNHGDNAMMQVAVDRLRQLWPDAEIGIVTSRPDKLPDYCPLTNPIPEEERSAWLSGRSLLGAILMKIPANVSVHAQNLERWLWLQYPWMICHGVAIKAKLLGRRGPDPYRFCKRLSSVDLLVVSGMGLINDAFSDSAVALLDELEAAIMRGVRVVAMGQGIGPITDPALRARAARVLPKLTFIALRERHAGPQLLRSLGVPSDKIAITGDDAIELAYALRPSSLGEMIGINLRFASYSAMGEEMIAGLRQPLRSAAEALQSSLTPVPISLSNETSDSHPIGELLEDRSITSKLTEVKPQDVIHVIGTCRVVVTASYHAGVFALAQGIPVVALVHSAYYEQKFRGLEEQFGCGCSIVDLRKPLPSDNLKGMICGAWRAAEHLRAPLLKSAASQVESSRAAYLTVHRMISSPPGHCK